MSVTKHGVKGYEYQYKVTVLVGLLQCYSPNEKLFVETKGSEDAQIVNEANGVFTITEIQVKREKGLITIKKLTDWLCHFQEHKGDNNLLHRILSEDNTMVLFVTRSRCSDDTVTLKADFEKLRHHDEITLSKVKVTDSLKNKSFGSTKLMEAREQFCLEQSSTFGDSESFESTFKKVLIWEEISDERVDREVANLLNRKYHIAQSRTDDVYHNLLEVVKVETLQAIFFYPSVMSLVKTRLDVPE